MHNRIPDYSVARPARTFFKRNQKIRAGRTERCRHWTTHVSRQETRREKHPIRKLNPARPGRLLFPSHFPICQPDRPSVGSHLTPTGNYKHLDTISSAAAAPDTRPRDHVCPREEEPATVTQVFHLHEKAADADVGTHLSRVGRPEKGVKGQPKQMWPKWESRLVPQLLNSRNAGHRPVTDGDVTH